MRGKDTPDPAQLRALYAEADAQLDGWTCDLSSDCCHFARTGREPYLWPIEWALLDKTIAARGVKRGPLHVLPEDDRACPLLGRDGRCTVYVDRPFGCRTFFCDRGHGPTRKPPRRELQEIGARVAALAREHDPECDGPRPLSTWLRTRK